MNAIKAECDHRPRLPTSCELCGATRIRPRWTLRWPDYPGAFRLWECHECGAAFNAPRLDATAIRDQYDGDYYVFNESPARRWARATQLYVEHLLPLETQTAHRRLLEIGCAGGELLAIARARGWQTQGIEISPQAAQSARDEHGLDVRTGTLEEHADAVHRPCVAVANDVLEHVLSPHGFLATLRRILEPGGWISLETPNWGGAWRRLGGPRWLGINRFHIFLFNAGSLLRLMHQAGFRNCRTRSSTNLAYTGWGSRPELAGLLARVPAGLRWRAERWLNGLTPRSFARRLHANPPDGIEPALACIRTVERAPASVSGHTLGDNLTVIGRA